jgi:Zn-dependent protease
MPILPNRILLGAIWYAVFLFSLTCHEAAHALAAKLGGDLTAYRAGQVSLNPIPHMRREPFGTILMPLISFAAGGWMIGWASTPLDPAWRQQHPRRAAWMALAGPAANLALMVLAALLIHAGILTGYFRPPAAVAFSHVVTSVSPGVPAVAATLVSVLFSLNLLLGAFNLLPFPPLDGHSAVGIFLPDDAARRFDQALRTPSFAIVGLVLCWTLFGRIFTPLFRFAVQTLYPGLGYR